VLRERLHEPGAEVGAYRVIRPVTVGGRGIWTGPKERVGTPS